MRIIQIPLIMLLLQGIPELIAVVSLAFVIAGIPMKWKIISSIGIVLAIYTYVVRSFSIPFGIHTISIIILLFMALTILGKGEFSLSLIASLVSVLALVIFEFVCLSLLMPIFGVTPETLSIHPVIRIVITEPQVILISLIAFLLNYYKKEVNNESSGRFQ